MELYLSLHLGRQMGSLSSHADDLNADFHRFKYSICNAYYYAYDLKTIFLFCKQIWHYVLFISHNYKSESLNLANKQLRNRLSYMQSWHIQRISMITVFSEQEI